MALAFPAPLHVLGYIVSQSRPPVALFHEVYGPCDPWVAICRCVVAGRDDGPSFLQGARNYSSAVFSPLSVYILEAMGVHPSPDDAFVLFHLQSSCCLYEQMIREHHDVLIIVFACIVVLPS